MPKRVKDKNKSIFVRFHDMVSDEEINSLLSSMDLTGSRVSCLVNRWAIEVPFWREEIYMTKFSDSDLVDRVHEGFDRKRKNTQIEEEAEIDE